MMIERFKDKKEALRAMTDQLMRLVGEKKEAAPFNLALSGGGTAGQLFALWADEYKDKIDWDRLRFFWVDERCVPPADKESNFGQADRLLFHPLQIPAGHIHRIRGECEPGVEAMRYAWEVKEYLPRFNQLPTFDCIILGVGEDAHTASIFPTTLELLTDSRVYAVSRHPSTGQFRITMTGPLILNGAPLLVLMLGKNKAPVLRELMEGYSPVHPTPAAYILSQAVEAAIFFAED